MNNTMYVSPKESAYCPECKTHPQQMRTRNHAERFCSAGHTFTLSESKEAEAREVLCQGYRWPHGSICGNECDPGKLCDQCSATKAEAELPLENAAYLEEFGVERVKAYPHLTDQQNGE